MTTQFIISQAFVLIAIITYILSYLTKNRKLIVTYRIIIPLAYAASYLVLAAYAAVYANIVSAVRTVVFLLFIRKEKECPLWLYLIFQVAIIVVSALTWDGLITLALILANLIDAHSVWQKEVKLYRWLSLPVSVLFGLYSFYYGSYLAFALEVVVLVVKIVSVINYYQDKKEETQKTA